MPVRIALVGADDAARALAETLQSLDEARVVAVCAGAKSANSKNAIEYSKAETLARRVKAKAFRDVKTMLRDETPDALCVVAARRARRDAQLLGMPLGLDIFLIPPFATSLQGAQTSLQNAAQARSRLWISHHERWLDSSEGARKLLAARGQMPLSCHGSWRIESENGIVEAGKGEAKSGAFLESSTRLIGLLRFLLGDINHVFARSYSTSLALNLEFACGTIGAFVLDAASENSLQFASQAQLVEWRENTLTIRRGQETQRIEYSNDARRAELRLWIQSVQSGRRTLQKSNPQDSLQTLRVALAIQQSAKTNKPVRIN